MGYGKYKEIVVMADAYTLHCGECLCVLGVSQKNLQKEETYCLGCAKYIDWTTPKTSEAKHG